MGLRASKNIAASASVPLGTAQVRWKPLQEAFGSVPVLLQWGAQYPWTERSETESPALSSLPVSGRESRNTSLAGVEGPRCRESGAKNSERMGGARRFLETRMPMVLHTEGWALQLLQPTSGAVSRETGTGPNVAGTSTNHPRDLQNEGISEEVVHCLENSTQTRAMCSYPHNGFTCDFPCTEVPTWEGKERRELFKTEGSLLKDLWPVNGLNIYQKIYYKYLYYILYIYIYK